MSTARRWRWRLVGLPTLMATCACPALAQPSIWDVAREPSLADEYTTLVSVELFLLGHASAWEEMNVHKSTIDYLRGERYSDPRVELLLGQLRVETTQRGEPGVRERLLDTLQRYPASPLAPRGFLELARIAALQQDLKAARHYYSVALEGLWEPELRANAWYGRAKATMESGRPGDALDDYQKAIVNARSAKFRALAHWGRGVAFERHGHLNAAFQELRMATSIRVRSTAFVARTVLDLPDVFFVPAFDKAYYKALAIMAEAQISDVPAQAVLDFQSAIAYFDRYLGAAKGTEHPYQQNAHRLRKRCASRVQELQAREPGRGE